ncbi:MAG: glycosyltransferase [Pirellulales bacterium]|nr:glycosyltransferase [Pirellulales bacterium]
MLRIFIGFDSRFPEPADVLAYSFRKHASIPLEIRYLKLSELGLNRAHDPLASTEFTYSRFLVPHLCNFQGKALFVDNDMLCLGDVRPLAELDMTNYALRVVQHDYQPTNTVKMYGAVQTSYPRKNWSSMMLMDCAKLRLWTKELVETQTGAYLHRFQDIPDAQIGELPKTWNTLDWMDEQTQLIHYTNGGPWFEQYLNHPHAGIWFRYRDEYRAQLATQEAAKQKSLLKSRAVVPPLSFPLHGSMQLPLGK